MVNVGVAGYIKFSKDPLIPTILATVLAISLVYLVATTSAWGSYLLGADRGALDASEAVQ